MTMTESWGQSLTWFLHLFAFKGNFAFPVTHVARNKAKLRKFVTNDPDDETR